MKQSRRRRDRGAAAAGGDDYDIDEAFKVYDTDSDGFISKDEVGTVIRALGKCPTNKQLEEMLSGVEGTSARIATAVCVSFTTGQATASTRSSLHRCTARRC